MDEIPDTQTRRRASTALFLGVVGVFASVVVVGAIAGGFAVRQGNKALRAIDESEGRITGRPMARLGVILGWLAMALSLIALGVWIIAPANRGSRDEARVVGAESNMRGILMACRLYADDYNEILPPHLAAAITGGYGITPLMLHDPRSQTPPLTLPAGIAEAKGGGADWHAIAPAVDANCYFLYLGAGLNSTDADPRLIILVAKLPAGEKRLAGTIGGEVEEMGEGEFGLRLALTNQARSRRGLPEIHWPPSPPMATLTR
jgi:hypothetical protein